MNFEKSGRQSDFHAGKILIQGKKNPDFSKIRKNNRAKSSTRTGPMRLPTSERPFQLKKFVATATTCSSAAAALRKSAMFRGTSIRMQCWNMRPN
jgi:hypothetical protein